MRVAVISVLLVLAVLATSCATAEDAVDEPAAATEPAADERDTATGTAVEVDPADAEPTAEVDITGFSFEPAVIEIEVGDTLRWTNGDATRHTVTAGADGEPTDAFHLTFGDRGDSAALKFTEAGEYRYFCTPHPFMEGTVMVSG